MKKVFTVLLVLTIYIVGFLEIPSFAEPSTHNKYTIPGKDGDVTIGWDSEKWHGKGECWAYAREIYYKIWKERFSNSFWSSDNMLRKLSDDERKITTDNTRMFISQAKLGSTIRVASARSDTDPNQFEHDGVGGSLSTGKTKQGHSMIIVAKSSSGFTVIENRNDGRSERNFTWQSFTDDFANKYIYFKYIKYPGAPVYTPYTVVSKADDYYTVSGISPDPTATGYGFTTDPLYGGSSQVPTYVSPYSTASIARQKHVFSYFHAVENIRNENGEIWVRLDDSSFVKKSDLVFQFKMSSSTAGLYKANTNTQWGKAPFDAKSKGVDIANGTEVHVARIVENKHGNKWYELDSIGSDQWVYSGHFTFIKNEPTLTITGGTCPMGTLEKGKSFTLKGIITASENITQVKGTIYNRSTNTIVPPSTFSKKTNPVIVSPNSKSFSVQPSDINAKLTFGDLPDGIYRYILEATTSSGFSKVLVESSFTIGNGTSTIQVSSITLNAVSIDLLENQSYTITATVNPNNATNTSINWSTSNSSIASVSKSGAYTAIVTANGEGTTTITATAADGSGKTASITVNVKQQYISIDIPSTASVELGKQIMIAATQGSVTDFSWSSSNSDIVKVKNGYLYGNKPGTAVITATTTDGNTSGTCTVTVTTPTTNVSDFDLHSQYSIRVPDAAYSQVLCFVPKVSADYIFEQRDDSSDGYGYIFDSNWNCIDYDDDGGSNRNFKIIHYLQSGQTYYLVARLYDPFITGVLTVGLEIDVPQETLALSTTKMVDITTAGKTQFFSFIPTESAQYVFTSISDYDTFGYICRDDWILLASDDDSGDNLNFSISYWMQAGETYYLGTRFYNQSMTDSFNIMIQKYVPVTGVSLNKNGMYVVIPHETLLEATITPVNATNKKLIWTSSDPSVATVDSNGYVNTVGLGQTTIIVTTEDGGYTASCEIHTFVSGSCGENVNWNYYGDINNLLIYGNGAIYDYEDPSTRPWSEYESQITSVTVDEGITEIGKQAFYNLTALSSVSLPSTLIKIGYDSFGLCRGLSSITLPQSLQTIDEGAFWESGISDIWIPKGVTSIGFSAFSYCNITSINIPSTVTTIDSYAFYGCKHLTSINVAAANTKYCSDEGVLFDADKMSLICFPAGKQCDVYSIPDTVKFISAYSFSFSQVKIIAVSDNVKMIFNRAFSNNANLESIFIPKTVTYMGDGVFAESDNVTIYCFEDSVAHTYARDNGIAFRLLDTPLNNADFVVPAKLKIIEPEAFAGIASKRVKLSEIITSIGSKAFADCPNLVAIYIPEGCTAIAADAFSGVTNLTVFSTEGSYAEFYANRHGYDFVAVTGN